MIGILFSTNKEAAPFLEQYERGRFSGLQEGEVAEDDRFLVTITGLGKIKATLRTDRFLNQHPVKRLMHIGTCTALNPEVKSGTIFNIEQILEGDRIELATPSYPRMPLATRFEQLEKKTLVTQDHTPNSEEQMYWQRIADVTDTVGYAYAFVAATHGKRCDIIKVVAGHCNQQDPNLRQTLSSVYNVMSGFLLEHVVRKK